MRRSPMERASTWSGRRTVRFTGAPPDVVEAVLERDQHSCVVCGQNLHGTRGRDFALHHRRPRRMGGDKRPDTNLPANLVSVCNSCHDWIESRRTEAADMGLILHADADPTQHVVATWYGSVLLDNAAGLWPVAA